MTLAQIGAFVKAVSQVRTQETLNDMSSMRVAQHADEKSYTKLIKDIQRDM